jgi:hypothetical protein
MAAVGRLVPKPFLLFSSITSSSLHPDPVGLPRVASESRTRECITSRTQYPVSHGCVRRGDVSFEHDASAAPHVSNDERLQQDRKRWATNTSCCKAP